MRGEDDAHTVAARPATGSPPHARGRRTATEIAEVTGGITPACAGKTENIASHAASPPDHPRMRGEDPLGHEASLKSSGSPPHARGRPVCKRDENCAARITPACAGKTR